MLLSSSQQFSSIKSGSAAVSLINVSRSSMKSNSADLTLASCCLFLSAFSSTTPFILTYLTAISSSIGPSQKTWTGNASYAPGSWVVTVFSELLQVVDSASLMSLGRSLARASHLCWLAPVLEVLAVFRCKSFQGILRQCVILLISLLSSSSALLGIQISLPRFLFHCDPIDPVLLVQFVLSLIQ